MKYHHNNQLVAFITQEERDIVLIALLVPFLSEEATKLAVTPSAHSQVLCSEHFLEKHLLEHKLGKVEEDRRGFNHKLKRAWDFH